MVYICVRNQQQQKQQMPISKEQLKMISDQLPTGAKTEMADALGCDPSKISRALRGFVRDAGFMAKLLAEARKHMGAPTVA